MSSDLRPLFDSPTLSEGFNLLFKNFTQIQSDENLLSFSKGLEILWELFPKDDWNINLLNQSLSFEQIHYLSEFLQAKNKNAEALALLRETARRTEGRVNLLLQNDLYQLELKVQGKDPEQNLKNKYCFCPFESLWIGPDGECRFCFWSASIGNIKKESLQEIWSGPVAQSYRNAMMQGSYFFCNKILCYEVRKNNLASKEQFFNKIPKEKMEQYIEGKIAPVEYELSYDLSCPHSCPSCRKDNCSTELELLNSQEKEQLTTTILKQTNNIRRVLLSCYGEFFYSKPLMSFLENVDLEKNPDLEFHLLSDGSFFNPQNFNRLARLRGRIKRVYISLDSLNNTNYQKIRPQSQLEQVLTNLEFIAQLRKKGEIREFMLVTTVQHENYLELTDLIRKGLELKVDEIRFKRLRQKGTFTPQEFAHKDICDPEHPQHPQFLEMLKDPLFQYPQVNLIDIMF